MGEAAILNLSVARADEPEFAVVSEPLRAPRIANSLRPVPDEPALSTVSEITSCLVGHTLETVERELILHTLQHCAGNRAWAAGLLGISVPALEAKLRRHVGPRIVAPHRGDNENAPVDLPDDLPPPRPAPRRTPARRSASGDIGLRWVIGSVLTVLAIIAAAFRFFGDNTAVASLVRAEPPRIELAIMERRLPPQPAALPLLVAPPAAPAVEPVVAADIEQDTRMDSAPTADAATIPDVASRETLAEAAAGFEENVVTVTAFESQLPQLEKLDLEASAAIIVVALSEPDPAPEPTPVRAPRPALTDQPKREARAERPAPRPAPVATEPKAKAEFNPLHLLFPFAILLHATAKQAGGPATAAQPLCCSNN